METHQVRYFLAACETLNLTRAAEHCGVSVPSLTKAVQKLEGELGGQLFRRERHLTHLTDLGRLMQLHFSAAQRALDAATADAGKYSALSEGRLKLGIFATMPARHLTAYLRALSAAAPKLELNLWEANCEEIASALLGGEIDLAIMSSADFDERLRPVALYTEAYCVAFAAGHRFAAMNAVPLREIDGENYIKRIHCEFHANFGQLGMPEPYQSVNVRYMTEREDWVQAMVAAGLGMTVMPEFLAILPGIEMRRLIEPEVHRQISIVTVAGRPHSKPVATAIKAATEMVWEGAGAASRPVRAGSRQSATARAPD